MRQEQFNQIINLLNTDEYFGISVFNLSSGVTTIEKQKTKEQIIEKYGSVEAFFNGLFQNGVTKIGIQPLRKNGKNKGIQNWINHPKHPYLDMDMNPKQEVAPQNFQSSAPVQYSTPALNGNNFGMGLPQLIDLHADSRDKIRLEERNKSLESENKRLNEQIYEFKDKELKWNNSTAKSEQTAGLMQAVIQNLDKLPHLVGAFKATVAVAPVAEAIGLGNPNFSAVKNALIKDISTTDDFTAQMLSSVYDKFSNETFVEQLNELLKN